MKKIISLLLVVGLVLSSATLAFANENEISVYVDGQKVQYKDMTDKPEVYHHKQLMTGQWFRYEQYLR